MSNPPVYLMGTHRYAFRPNQPAVIHGVVMYPSARNEGPIICFHIIYPDGAEDFVPLYEAAGEPSSYEIGAREELTALSALRGQK